MKHAQCRERERESNYQETFSIVCTLILSSVYCRLVCFQIALILKSENQYRKRWDHRRNSILSRTILPSMTNISSNLL